ncbi:MAG: ATP-binding protein [Actinomycetota bacterium]
MVGRSTEIGLVASHLERLAGGTGGLILIEGEAGIGKTRLVEEALSRARDLGLQVLFGSAEELEARRPFGVIADCLEIDPASPDEGLATVGRLLLGGARSAQSAPVFVDAPAFEFRLMEAVLSLVEDLCARAPTAMAIEDLQWADPATLLVLHRLARLVPHLPLALLWTCRRFPDPRCSSI